MTQLNPHHIPPTLQFYSELQEAFDHFNHTLFENKLPPCIITLQRESRTYGYYSVKRFVSPEGAFIDEIALNPEYFAVRSIPETLSTLAHEMVHLQQQHFGAPGRGRYHNHEWANWMDYIGLIPSHTGKEGGKRTGDRMSHYILKHGKFDHACQTLITKDYQLSWMDRFPPIQAVTNLSRSLQVLIHTKKAPNDDALINSEVKEGEATFETPLPLGAALLGGTIPVPETQEGSSPRPVNRSNRLKYQCPNCHNQVWGKPNLNILCGDCQVPFVMIESS